MVRKTTKNKSLNDSDAGSQSCSETTDEKLMQRFQQGDVTAFDELFHRYKRRIYTYAYRFLSNPALSEEAVNELFLKVFETKDKYEPRAKFSTWLYTMLRNQCIDELRRSGNSESSSDLMLRLPSSGPSQEDQLHKKQFDAILQLAINTLSQEHREVFLMREKLNLPFAEIAEVLGCPESTVKSRMRYALENLRRYLSKHYNFKDLV